MIEGLYTDQSGRIQVRGNATMIDGPAPQLYNDVLFPECYMGPFNNVGNTRYWLSTWTVSFIFLTVTAIIGFGFWFNINQYRKLNANAQAVYLNYLEKSGEISSETALIAPTSTPSMNYGKSWMSSGRREPLRNGGFGPGRPWKDSTNQNIIVRS